MENILGEWCQTLCPAHEDDQDQDREMLLGVCISRVM
jgi:hypothetical protein